MAFTECTANSISGSLDETFSKLAAAKVFAEVWILDRLYWPRLAGHFKSKK